MNIIVGLPKMNRGSSIYLVVKMLSSYAHCIPWLGSVAAGRVVPLFVYHAWKLHGYLRSMITGREPGRVNAFWRAFITWVGTDFIMTIANCLEADGQMKRSNLTFSQYLRLFAQHSPAAWFDFLTFAECL